MSINRFEELRELFADTGPKSIFSRKEAEALPPGTLEKTS
jgi:hypothetical protein